MCFYNKFYVELYYRIMIDNTILPIPQKPEKSIYTKTKIINDQLTEDCDLNYLHNRFEQLASTFKDVNDINVEKSLDLFVFELLYIHEYLQKEHLNLEKSFANECKQYFEIIEKLDTKLRLISLSCLGIEGKLLFLNNKLPELEDMTMKHENLIHTLSYRYNDASYDTIKDLQNNFKNITEYINNMENNILNIKQENESLNKEIQEIMDNSLNVKNLSHSEKSQIQENLIRLKQENCELENKLEEVQCKKTQGVTFKEKIEKLETEIEALVNQIKISKRDKAKLIEENSNLKSVIKKLVFKQVLAENYDIQNI